MVELLIHIPATEENNNLLIYDWNKNEKKSDMKYTRIVRQKHLCSTQPRFHWHEMEFKLFILIVWILFTYLPKLYTVCFFLKVIIKLENGIYACCYWKVYDYSYSYTTLVAHTGAFVEQQWSCSSIILTITKFLLSGYRALLLLSKRIFVPSYHYSIWGAFNNKRINFNGNFQ